MKQTLANALSTISFVVASAAAFAGGQYAPGVTDTEIKVGQTMPYSGPASAWGAVGKGELAYVKMINDRGGVRGRKINLISLDDGFSPPKTVEQTRRLVEADGVAFIFGTIGFGNLAIRDYLNERRVPQVFAQLAVQGMNDPQHYPWTIGFLPTTYHDALIHAQYILIHKPEAKIAILHQNDEAGEEAVKGLRKGLGDRADKLIVKELSYEGSDPTIEFQIVALKASGADTFYNVAYTKFASQAIRKAERDWLEAASFSCLLLSIDRCRAAAGRAGNCNRHHLGHVCKGSDRSSLGRGCKHQRLSCLAAEISPGRKAFRNLLLRRIC